MCVCVCVCLRALKDPKLLNPEPSKAWACFLPSPTLNKDLEFLKLAYFVCRTTSPQPVGRTACYAGIHFVAGGRPLFRTSAHVPWQHLSLVAYFSGQVEPGEKRGEHKTIQNGVPAPIAQKP